MPSKDQTLSVKQRQRIVLITGCSDGGLGAALAIALHQAGLHVYATARNPSRLSQVRAYGIETFTLDVISADSIAAAVAKVPDLDILVNNAGALYSMPFSDMSIPRAKELFDLNVWSYLELTQAFLPALLRSKGIVVNQTSSAGLFPIGFQSAYNASKAAIIMFSDTIRLELAPLGIRVVDLKTSSTKANGFINQNARSGNVVRLPDGSLYEPAREIVEATMAGDRFPVNVTAENWAKQVTKELLRPTPPEDIWGGTNAWAAWATSVRPFALPKLILRKMVGLDLVEQVMTKSASS